MQDSDRKNFYQTWASAWESCGKTVTDRSLRFAFECLKAFDLEDVQRAVLQHGRDPDHGSFAPKPADIIRQIEGGGDERSLHAWTKLETGVKSVGSWSMLAFDDARIHAVIADMGGWMVFCTASSTDWPFLRNEFCKRYRGYLQNQPTAYPALIRGEGGFNEPPILIGNQEIAKNVMLAGSIESSNVKVGQLAQDFTDALPAPRND